MKSSSDAPDPDPNVGKSAVMQARTGQQWLDFAKDAFKVTTKRQAELDDLTAKVTNTQLGVMRQQERWAERDRERYQERFRPVENQFIRQATNYASKERQAAAAAEAKADVRQAAQVQSEIAAREAAAMGVNPNSGRFAGIDRANDTNTALAVAGAANTARQNLRDKGLALKADVANMGRGLPAQSAQATSLGLGAGNSALAGKQAANSQFMQSTDIMGAGYRGQMAGYSGQASTLNQQYGLQLDAWKAEQQIAAQNAAGIGQAIGGIAGLFFSDENLKEDKQEIPEGEALDAVNNMPVEEWNYKAGVADEGRHIGTYAQDFQRETGKGDGRTIAAQDAIGITMKAVQDLDKKVDKIATAVGLGMKRAA